MMVEPYDPSLGNSVKYTHLGAHVASVDNMGCGTFSIDLNTMKNQDAKRLLEHIRERSDDGLSLYSDICIPDSDSQEDTLETYCENALRFFGDGFANSPIDPADGILDMPHLIEGLMGLTGEAGEAEEILKKYLFQGHAFDREHLIKELGDALWYLNLAAVSIGSTLGEVMYENTKKLENRYSKGVFDSKMSINRKEDDV